MELLTSPPGNHSKVPPGRDGDPVKVIDSEEQIELNPEIVTTGVGRTNIVEVAVLLSHPFNS
jgi:hypothetical protein